MTYLITYPRRCRRRLDRMKTAPHNTENRQGFALVVALSLMAFVLLLLLSISTLVQVETRSAEVSAARSEAHQNALLGLQQAMGALIIICL